MKIVTPYHDLLDALSWVAKTTGKAVLPVTAAMKLTVSNGTLTIAGTDYETIRRRHIVGEKGDDGELLVNGSSLVAAVKSLPRPETVTLTGLKNELSIVCRAARVKITYAAFDVQYPELPELPDALGIMPGRELAWAIMRVGRAASTEDLMPNICCIQMMTDGPMLRLTATDRSRAASDILTFDGPPSAQREMLLSARELMSFAQAVHDDRPVTLHGGNDFGALSDPGMSLMTRDLITAGGQFPQAFRQMMEAAVAHAVVAPDAAELTHAVDRARKLSDRQGLVRLELGIDSMAVVGVQDGQDAYREVLPGKALFGLPQTLLFNGRYLSELLAYIAGPVGIGTEGPGKPVQLMPGDPHDCFRGLLAVFPLETKD